MKVTIGSRLIRFLTPEQFNPHMTIKSHNRLSPHSIFNIIKKEEVMETKRSQSALASFDF